MPLNLHLPQSWVKLTKEMITNPSSTVSPGHSNSSLGDFSLLFPHFPNSASPRDPGAAASLGRCRWLQGHTSQTQVPVGATLSDSG